MNSDLNFCSMMCSRLCHDLVGPIGAIGNGIEILTEEGDPGMREQALGLLKRSAEQATNRLRYFRLAFGSSGGEDVPVGLGEARQVAVAFFADDKIEFSWPAETMNEGTVSKMALRLLLNMTLIGAGTLIRGGKLTAAISQDAPGPELTVTAVGQTVRLDDQHKEILQGSKSLEEIESRAVQSFLTAVLAKSQGSSIRISGNGESEITLSASIPG